MNRSLFFYVLYIVLIPAVVIAVDALFKFFIPTFQSWGGVGSLNFGDIHNAGFIMGGFANLSPVFRVICASTLLGFFFFVFVLIQYLLVPQVRSLRIGLSILVGSIAGNVIDRAYFGYVRDFISIIPNVFFNIADVFMTIGAALIIFSVFKYSEILWHPNSIRKGILINPKLQIAFSFKITLIAFAFTVVIASFAIAFMNTLAIPYEHMGVFAMSIFSLSGIFLVLTFLAGILLSHRSVGPLYAFEQFIEELLDGKNERPLKLREGDNYKHLEIIAEKIRLRLK